MSMVQIQTVAKYCDFGFVFLERVGNFKEADQFLPVLTADGDVVHIPTSFAIPFWKRESLHRGVAPLPCRHLPHNH